MTEKDKMETISEYFGEKFKGRSGTEESMTIVLKEREVIVKDYGKKTIEEIIEEIEKGG